MPSACRSTSCRPWSTVCSTAPLPDQNCRGRSSAPATRSRSTTSAHLPPGALERGRRHAVRAHRTGLVRGHALRRRRRLSRRRISSVSLCWMIGKVRFEEDAEGLRFTRAAVRVRAARQPLGKMHNSRRGLGVYYRYSPGASGNCATTRTTASRSTSPRSTTPSSNASPTTRPATRQPACLPRTGWSMRKGGSRNSIPDL